MADVDRRGFSDEKQDAEESKENKAETTEIKVHLFYFIIFILNIYGIELSFDILID
jgi:hypothetical protein